jgi:hypothetical protein
MGDWAEASKRSFAQAAQFAGSEGSGGIDLTPMGVTDRNSFLSASASAHLARCSTPVGVTESFNECLYSLYRCRVSAQLLLKVPDIEQSQVYSIEGHIFKLGIDSPSVTHCPPKLEHWWMD